ncbi:MAG: cell division protein FtsL [Marivivens sp.]|nr:cell division protein FtsL [Marivivens sp.]
MRGVLYVVTALVVIALGFWAYQQNYRTQDVIGEVRSLHADIGDAHARLRVLRAEWAYLNRPDRLRDLADLNFERLGLLPLQPQNFGSIEQITYPPAALDPIVRSIELSSSNAPDAEEPL